MYPGLASFPGLHYFLPPFAFTIHGSRSFANLQIPCIIVNTKGNQNGRPGTEATLAYIAFKQLKAPNLPISFSPLQTFSVWTVVLAVLVWSWGVCWHHHTWHGWAIWPGDPGVSAGDWQWQDAGLSLPLSASMGVIQKVKCKSATTTLRHTFSSFWEQDNSTQKMYSSLVPNLYRYFDQFWSNTRHLISYSQEIPSLVCAGNLHDVNNSM